MVITKGGVTNKEWRVVFTREGLLPERDDKPGSGDNPGRGDNQRVVIAWENR